MLLIRGAPGSGKSTLAAALRESLYSGATIEVDQLRGLVIRCDWGDRRTHAAAVGMACSGARELVRAGARPVVIVDTFAGLLPTATAKLAGLRWSALSLWIEPAELGRRLEARTRGYKDIAGALEVNASLRRVAIDATGLEIGELVEVALTRVHGMTTAQRRLLPA